MCCHRCFLPVHQLFGEQAQRIGVECRGQRLPALLYADDMVILADDEKMLTRALNEMGECYVEWSVKVNVDKCGIMHMRKKGVERMG